MARFLLRLPKRSCNSSSIMVCVMAPTAKNMELTPNMIRNELKTRPAWLSGRISP